MRNIKITICFLTFAVFALAFAGCNAQTPEPKSSAETTASAPQATSATEQTVIELPLVPAK